MKRWLLMVLLSMSFPLAAAEIVFYRCVDAAGALTVQNMPCPKGTQQQSKKVMQAVETAPPMHTAPPPAALPPSAPTPVPAATAAPAEATPAAKPGKEEKVAVIEKSAEPQPLPPLYQCQTPGGDAYLSEEEEPPSRCMSMRVTGLDGNPRTGAGEACEVVRDRCNVVADTQTCAIWKQRVQEAESHWRFATPQHVEALQREYERLYDLLMASKCSTAQ